jgi:hypothetical protein
MLTLAIVGFIIFFVILIWMLTRNSAGDPSGSFSSNIKLGSLPEKLIASLGTTNVTTKIIFNGKEYSSREDMPPEVRRIYDNAMATVLADENRDGIPDLFQGKGGSTIMHANLKSQLLDDANAKIDLPDDAYARTNLLDDASVKTASLDDADVRTRLLDDPAESLKKLKEMKDSGLITDEEFETKKAEILARM